MPVLPAWLPFSLVCRHQCSGQYRIECDVLLRWFGREQLRSGGHFSYRGGLATWNTGGSVVPSANCAIYQFDLPASADARINVDIAWKLYSANATANGAITVDAGTGTISGGGTFDGNWNPAAYNVCFHA